MKKMMIIAMLLFASLTVAATETTTLKLSDCEIRQTYSGTYYGSCPRDMVVTAARVDHPNGPFMPRTWVECSRLVIDCPLDPNDNRTE